MKEYQCGHVYTLQTIIFCHGIKDVYKHFFCLLLLTFSLNSSKTFFLQVNFSEWFLLTKVIYKLTLYAISGQYFYSLDLFGGLKDLCLSLSSFYSFSSKFQVQFPSFISLPVSRTCLWHWHNFIHLCLGIYLYFL